MMRALQIAVDNFFSIFFYYFQELKECFLSQDVGMLQTTIEKMDPEEAKYHMKRCVDSGLWVPNANENADKDEAPAE